MKHFDQFIYQLTVRKQEPLPKALETYICAKDYYKCLDYLIFISTNESLKSFKNYLKNLKPGESHRVSKEDSKLPRTLQIFRKFDKKYLLILETKSKLANNLKDPETKVKQGGFKKGKTTWRIDVPAEPYFNLVNRVHSDREYKQLINEVSISNQVKSKYILPYLMSKPFKQNKISIYSPKAIGTLDEFSKMPQCTYFIKQKLILDIMLGLKDLHDNGYIHQDIKPQNILVFKEKNTYIAKLIDFGLTTLECKSKSKKPLATFGYESPEISRYYALRRKDPLYSHFHRDLKEKSFGQYFDSLFSIMQNEKHKSQAHPDKSNDIWALGVVMLEFLFGYNKAIPSALHFMNKHLILSKIFNLKENRISLQNVINLQEKLLLPPAKDPKITPTDKTPFRFCY